MFRETTTGAIKPVESWSVFRGAEAPLFQGGSRGCGAAHGCEAKMASRQPAGCRRYGSRLPAVVIGLAGAFERDLVVRDFAAFVHWGSLGLGIGLRFRRRLRDMADVGRVNAADWSDHSGLLRDRIGRGGGNFRGQG